MSKMNQRNIYILSFTLVVVMLGFGIIMPIIPFYIEKLGASGMELGMLTAVSALMQFIFAPLWGTLSDRYGRKPVLLIGVIGYGVTMFLFGLATQLWVLFLARALNGILSSATLPTAMAYVADNTSADRRGSGMGQLGAAAGVGIILGPGIGGALAVSSLSTPFFVATGLCVVALLLVWLFLPESHGAEMRSGEARKPVRIFRLGLIKQVLTGSTGVLMLLTLVVSIGMSSFQGILGLYALDKFGFTTQQIGVIWMIVGAVTVVAQGLLTGPLTRRFGEVVVIRLSLAVTAAAFGLMLLAGAFLPLLLATSLLVLAIALLGPALNALISNRTTLEQGITLGVSNSVTSLGRILGPLWAGFIYELNIGFPFLSGSVILVIGFLISLAALTQQSGQPVPPIGSPSPE